MLCRTCRCALKQRINAPNRTPSTIFLRSVATASSTSISSPSITPPPSSSPSQTQSNTSSAASSSNSEEPPSTDTAASTSASKRPSAFAPKRLQSSVAGGAELRGLSYNRGAPPLVAKEDHEYPEWLWMLLETPKGAGADSGTADSKLDLASMSKKTRAKHERKQAKLLASVEKPVPVHEQSKDLTGPEDDAVTSIERRAEVTKSSRVARRKSIREDNFLRGM